MPTDFDVKVGNTWAKIKKTENGGYTRRTIRREIENNLLSQSENPALMSRGDRPALYQTSWAGGSRWWKPLITPTDLTSYYQSNHFDAWGEPGRLVPTNRLYDSGTTILHENCIIADDGSSNPVGIGNTNTIDSTTLDLYRRGAGGSWGTTPVSTITSGVDDGDNPLAIAYDANDGYFYVLSDGGEVTRFSLDATADDAAWITGLTFSGGSAIFVQNGNLLFYNGESIYTIDKSGPSATERANDGRGPELISGFRTSLAIATPEGIYYVKNTMSGRQPEAWVMRVERDAAGNWNLHPIATLPPGNLALDITYHLGQVLISATPHWRGLTTSVISLIGTPEVNFYYFGSGGAGVLGSPLGKDGDEMPFAFLGSEGPHLYIAGHKRLWVYDGIRGGLHTAWEWPTAGATKLTPYRAMYRGTINNSPPLSTDHLLGFATHSREAYILDQKSTNTGTYTTDDPDTVTNFGDDETHYALTSNFFDGGLPMEMKELTKVAILREAGDGDQEWTVQLSADGGAFADALVHSTSGEIYAEADLSGTRGRKFQYRVIYQTKDASRNALEALLVGFTTGEQITEWDLMLDGTEMLNIDNKVQDEEVFYDSMKALAAQGAIIDFVDNMQEQGRLSGDSTPVEVKVMAVEIVKSKPGESTVRVVLREA